MSDANEAMVQAQRVGDALAHRAAQAAGADSKLEMKGSLEHVYHGDVPVLVLAARNGEPALVEALLDAGAEQRVRRL